MSTWRCGDCGCEWDKSVYYCPHKFSDYLAVHGGSVEAAINLAVSKAIDPLVNKALNRLRKNPYKYEVVWTRVVGL